MSCGESTTMGVYQKSSHQQWLSVDMSHYKTARDTGSKSNKFVVLTFVFQSSIAILSSYVSHCVQYGMASNLPLLVMLSRCATRTLSLSKVFASGRWATRVVVSVIRRWQSAAHACTVRQMRSKIQWHRPRKQAELQPRWWHMPQVWNCTGSSRAHGHFTKGFSIVIQFRSMFCFVIIEIPIKLLQRHFTSPTAVVLP